RLSQQLDHMLRSLDQLRHNPDVSQVLEDKTKRIAQLKRRLTLIHSIVQNCNQRVAKLVTTSAAIQSTSR
ncbi:unnamed protein product, partial [Oppiella nova]